MRVVKRQVEPVPIDIAPLIDVVFQLLLFFMLTSSFVLAPGIRVTLPKAETGAAIAASNLIITLTKDHLIYWGEELVTLQELTARLKRGRADRPVLIRTDRHAFVERLMALWDLCRDAGYREVHIATQSE